MTTRWFLLYLCGLLLLFLPRATTFTIERRRAFLQAGSGVCSALLLPQPVFATDNDATTAPYKLEVTITLPSNIDREELLGPDTALYVTARPTDNQVFEGRRAPPVLTTRVATPSSLQTVLTEKDATSEGMSWGGWKTGPLVVSARLDTDGLASTRNATDLVGQGTVAADGTTVTVPLQGRGFAGKLLTGGK